MCLWDTTPALHNVIKGRNSTTVKVTLPKLVVTTIQIPFHDCDLLDM